MSNVSKSNARLSLKVPTTTQSSIQDKSWCVWAGLSTPGTTRLLFELRSNSKHYHELSFRADQGDWSKLCQSECSLHPQPDSGWLCVQWTHSVQPPVQGLVWRLARLHLPINGNYMQQWIPGGWRLVSNIWMKYQTQQVMTGDFDMY